MSSELEIKNLLDEQGERWQRESDGLIRSFARDPGNELITLKRPCLYILIGNIQWRLAGLHNSTAGEPQYSVFSSADVRLRVLVDTLPNLLKQYRKCVEIINYLKNKIIASASVNIDGVSVSWNLKEGVGSANMIVDIEASTGLSVPLGGVEIIQPILYYQDVSIRT